MAVTMTRDQAPLTRLAEIEDEIADQFRVGVIFPRRREAAAEKVVALRKEAEVIAAKPEQYREPEPLDTEDEFRRERKIGAMVKAIFRDAPQQDVLTEALVTHWTEKIGEAAAQGDERAYNKASQGMREDAEVARRARPDQSPYQTPPAPDDPERFLQNLTKLIERARADLDAGKAKSAPTWRRAGNAALDQLSATAQWIRHENKSQGLTDAPGEREALKEQCLILAVNFNEIRHAIRTRR